MLESKYQSQSHLRCFGNWWGRHTCSGSGFGKLQHSQFLAAATVAFEHGEEHGLAAPTFVGRQSYRVPWFSSLTSWIASPKKDIPNILNLSQSNKQCFQLCQPNPGAWMCTRSRSISRTLCTKGTVERRASSVSWSILLTVFFDKFNKCWGVQNYEENPRYFWITIPMNQLHLTGMAGVGTHASVAFAKSKALLGSISGVERSRVQDLQNPDGDRPLAPHYRVAWS